MPLEHFLCRAEEFGLFYNLNENFSELQSGVTQIILIESGCALLSYLSKNLFIQSGMMLLRSSNTVFDIVYSKNLSALSISFKPELLLANHPDCPPNLSAGLLDPSGLLGSLVSRDAEILPLNPLNRARLKNLFIAAIDEMINEKDSFWLMRTSCLLKELLLLSFSTCIPLDNRGNSHANLAMKTLDFVHENYNKKITVHMLCKMFLTNHTSILKAFRSYTGTTIGQYILDLRINLVSNALLFTDLTLEKIAEQYGFGQVSYLSRVFRSRVGLAPGQFRSLISDKKIIA